LRLGCHARIPVFQLEDGNARPPGCVRGLAFEHVVRAMVRPSSHAAGSSNGLSPGPRASAASSKTTSATLARLPTSLWLPSPPHAQAGRAEGRRCL